MFYKTGSSRSGSGNCKPFRPTKRSESTKPRRRVVHIDRGGSVPDALRLAWAGHETLGPVLDAVKRGGKVEIALPQSLHHAVFRRLHPGPDSGAAEIVDARGGPELAETLATLAGLDALAELIAPLGAAGYRLHLISPAPMLSLLPPE